jgi:hypothetical protein
MKCIFFVHSGERERDHIDSQFQSCLLTLVIVVWKLDNVKRLFLLLRTVHLDVAALLPSLLKLKIINYSFDHPIHSSIMLMNLAIEKMPLRLCFDLNQKVDFEM